MAPVARPKLRSRKDGAAVPLDATDKRLLNLMQGHFPLAPRPYQHVAAEAGIEEAEALQRVERLLDDRIIRQVTPIFDTRALGYASMLVAAKVDPEHPWRAAKIINAHPGVSHNYLRNHDFNIWFTIATEPDSMFGLERTLEVLGHEAGATSIRKLPTLKLFKIRMDLEMEGSTADLARAAAAVEPAETEPQPYDERDMAIIRALQGDLPVVPEPYAPTASALGMARPTSSRTSRAWSSAGSCAAWPPSSSTAGPVLGQRHGRLERARRPRAGDRQADGLLPRHLALLPAPHLPGLALLALHHGSRSQQGGVRRDPRRDRGGHRHHQRATLYSSTEFKKVRLLYFTDDYKNWERARA